MPGLLPGIYWQLNPPLIEFTSIRDGLTPDYSPGIYRQIKLEATLTSEMRAYQCISDHKRNDMCNL